MRKFLFVLCLLLFSCADNSVPYVLHESEALGISFEYPASWVLEASDHEVNVATDENLFVDETADFNSGAVVNFSALPLEMVNRDIEMALEQFVRFVAASEDVGTVGEIDLFTLSGREAAQARVNLTETATLLVVMIEDKEQVILVAAIYDMAQYEDVIVHLVEGIAFNE